MKTSLVMVLAQRLSYMAKWKRGPVIIKDRDTSKYLDHPILIPGLRTSNMQTMIRENLYPTSVAKDAGE